MLAIRSAVEPVHLSIAGTSPARTSIGSRRNPDSTRAILDAAAALLAEEGYAGFSVDAIARRARCGKPTIYRWWPDQLAILIDLHEQAIAELPVAGDIVQWMTATREFWNASLAGPALRAIAAEAQSADDGRERLRAAVAPYEAAARTTGDGSIDPALARTAASVAIFAWLSDGQTGEVRRVHAEPKPATADGSIRFVCEGAD